MAMLATDIMLFYSLMNDNFSMKNVLKSSNFTESGMKFIFLCFGIEMMKIDAV